MLTTEQLNAIKERAEKATAGEWFVLHHTDIAVENPPGSSFADGIAFADGNDDAEFIAHARGDIPALLQTVEALTAILAETEETRDKIAKDWSNLLDERVTLKSKIATYESLAQEFNYGAILDEMACEGGDSDD
ncbi:hypothetical protein [Niallia sp. FSL M8-0099]|uniref:hypothetical protein n=1 Tax=Niallia sp. FSL M8-0099 TaxID=2954519 RepID=UPI0030FCB6C2